MLVPLRYGSTAPVTAGNSIPVMNGRTTANSPDARTAPAPKRASRSVEPAVGITVRRAEVRDMRLVAPLISRFAERNLMLAKSDDQLVRAFREFLVAADEGGRIVGCGALRVYSEQLAEIVSLAVDESVQGTGIGRLIVEGLVDDAGSLGIASVFALTLQESFFHRNGFRTVAKERFPLKVWADCRACPKLHACDEIAVVRELS